ncbi:MAG: MmcQ/YjbR family DNA-binding protein [Gemmatimonadota bacterium]|nr:MmcQ/YjbR family DNA-binding protein [Gemmatimonadota bacterium]
MTAKRAPSPSRKALKFADVRQLAMRLPGVEENSSYGTPALKVRGKLLVRLKEDNETIVLRVDFLEREHLIQSDPASFYFTDHYRNYPAVLVRLAAVDRQQLSQLIEDAWRKAVTKKIRDEYDAQS